MPRSEPIFKIRLKLEDGHLLAPQGPGRGVLPDEAAWKRYKVEQAVTVPWRQSKGG